MATAAVEAGIKSTGQILLTYQGYMDLHGFSVPRLQKATLLPVLELKITFYVFHAHNLA
jgi:hypothetical protein